MTTRRRNAPPGPTAWHTTGPFFPAGLAEPALADLTRPGHAGEAVWLEGRVEDATGPFDNAVVELWQADAAGRFAHPLDPDAALATPCFAFWGRALATRGEFRFRTVLPGAYADPAGPRAPHFDITVMGSGIMRRLPTTLFLPGHPANAADPVLRAVPEALRERLLLAEAPPRDGLRRFRAELRLQGARETPFFRD